MKNREFAAPAVGRLAVDDFQNFGTFWATAPRHSTSLARREEDMARSSLRDERHRERGNLPRPEISVDTGRLLPAEAAGEIVKQTASIRMPNGR